MASRTCCATICRTSLKSGRCDEQTDGQPGSSRRSSEFSVASAHARSCDRYRACCLLGRRARQRTRYDHRQRDPADDPRSCRGRHAPDCPRYGPGRHRLRHTRADRRHGWPRQLHRSARRDCGCARHCIGRSQAGSRTIDARHGQVYFQLFGSGGRTLMAPRIATLRDAVRAATAGSVRIVGTAAGKLAAIWPREYDPPLSVEQREAPDIEWVARLGAAAAEGYGPPKPLYLRAPDAQPQSAAQLPRR